MLSVLSGRLSVFVCVCVPTRGGKVFRPNFVSSENAPNMTTDQTADTFWDISKTLFSTLSQQHASMVSTFPSKLHRKVSRRRRRKTRREIFFSVNNFYIPFFFFGIFLCELTSLFFRFSSPTPADSALLFSLLIRHDPTCVCICDALSLLLFCFVFSLIASTLFHLGSVCILSWHKFPDLSRLFSYLLCNYANMYEGWHLLLLKTTAREEFRFLGHFLRC